MQFVKRFYGIVIVLVILQGLVAYNCAKSYLSLNNTLAYNGRWTSSKTKLSKGVFGAFHFMCSRQALAGGGLNLGAWHGYQEIMHAQKLPAREIRFEFKGGEKTYLALIFNKTQRGFYGIRFGDHKLYDDLFFIAKPDGEFVSKRSLDLTEIMKPDWNAASVRFGAEGFSLILNDELVESFDSPLQHEQSFGFRGGYKDVFLDNVVVLGENQRILLNETFSNSKNAFLVYAVIFIALGAANFLLYWTIRLLSGKNPKPRGLAFKLIVLNVAVLILSFVLPFFQKIYVSKYPVVTAHMKEGQNYWRGNAAKFVCHEIKKKYAEKDPSSFRILIIGTSQTWGAGAGNDNETFVHIVENQLNGAKKNDRRYECINAGISASNSTLLYPLYEKQWVGLEPNLVVINLSNNDSDPVVFKNNLERFVQLNKTRGIETAFVLEPNSIDHRPNMHPMHKVMVNVAKERQIPLINLHGILKRNYDTGFLWWDMVHLTSYGHRLAGKFLADEITKLTGSPSD